MRLSRVLGALAACSASACARPYLANDGTLIFQEPGAHGASVLTANGLEFHDRTDVPERIVVRDPSEPWRAPIGFILPANGRFTETSQPTIVATTGLAIAMRPSDTRVPSWGGEVLVRVDVLAPAAAGSARWGEDIVVVLDGRGEDTNALAGIALSQLGGRDRVSVVDAIGAEVVLPMMPATNRSLGTAAVEQHLARPSRGKRDLAKALGVARTLLAARTRAKTTQRVLVLTDVTRYEAPTPALTAELRKLQASRAVISAIATTAYGDARAVSALASGPDSTYSVEASLDVRGNVVRDALPAPGVVAFRDVVLSFEGTPAPSHVLEASGGDVRWQLDSGELALGDVRAGDERTEVVRVTVPAWAAGQPFSFKVTARFDDVARSESREISANVPCTYDDDIERIANSRNGDVIAYSSALATLKRLDSAFVGAGVAHAGGLYKVALLHARSMTLLARDTKDRAIIEQAELLNALLATVRP